MNFNNEVFKNEKKVRVMQAEAILFIGLGSIARKHIGIIKRLYPHFKIIAVRSSPHSPETEGVENYYELATAIRENNIFAAFLTNPTSKHVETAITIALNKIHLFIEKPLSNTLNNIDELQEIVNRNNIVCYTAYNFRFNPLINNIKKLIEKENPSFCRIVNTSYLPSWRKNTDYRKSYSARKDLGGNIVLDLSHEIDYVNYFSEISNLEIRYVKTNTIETTVDDIADIWFQTEKFPGSIHLSFSSRKLRREIELQFKEYVLICDLLQGKFDVIYNKDDKLSFRMNDYRIENMYIDQIKYFIRSVKEENFDCINNINASRKLFDKMIYAIHKSQSI